MERYKQLNLLSHQKPVEKIETRLLEFAQRQKIEPVGDIIKTQSEFENNYKKHDKATRIILPILQPSFILGRDLREKKGKMLNECPDYYYKNSHFIFAYDIKAKSFLDDFGKLNKRAFDSYKDLSGYCDCPVYLCFCLISSKKPHKFVGRIGYSYLEWSIIEKNQEWNGNLTVKLEWTWGLPNV